MRVNISLGAFPGKSHGAAAAIACSGEVSEPFFGSLSYDHLQLCPQNFGHLSEDLVDVLLDDFAGKTQFRLHANVRVLPSHVLADLSGFVRHEAYFKQAAKISKRLGAPAYTAHAGKRSECSVEALYDNAKRAADLFGCPVGIEGHYPNKSNSYLVSTWSEYQHLFQSGLSYALDLSHLNIVAAQSGQYELTLIKEMLSSNQCLEVHVSENDGLGDTHQQIGQEPWWDECVKHIHPLATIFSEGNQLRNVVARTERIVQ